MRLHRLIDPIATRLLALGRRPGRPSGVLLVSAGGLGDTVLFALVLPRLMELAQPGEEVTVLLRSDGARMSFLFPQGVKVRKVDFKRLRDVAYRRQAAQELYRAHYRLVVHTDYLRHPDLDEFLVAAAHAPEAAAMEPRPSAKHGRRLRANRRLYTRLFESGPAHADKVLRWARFADFLIGRTAAAPQVLLAPAARPPAEALPAPTVLFQPFSAVALKQSPPQLWEQIARALPEGWRVKLAGHPSDLDKNPDFHSVLELPNVEFEGAPFDRLAGIIQGCRLVVSVDTACMHLAVALGAPTLCLASAAYMGEIVPYAAEITPANAHFLYRPMECQGCLGACTLPPERGMYPCVAALDTDAVLAKVAALIGGEP
ncbi:MAG TPA: glycosyltransferase family 9 protein [Magnetospirillum sp.]|nr:glycosyltransferase family 9 protein [Magnetospirillum sp.]